LVVWAGFGVCLRDLTCVVGWTTEDLRLRDWLALLSFEHDAARFGCFRWPAQTDQWLDRVAWMEHHGQRWWPVFGAVYLISAVKCVRGMRLVGLAQRRAQAPAVKAAAAVRRG
jgi:hypothetical protein